MNLRLITVTSRPHVSTHKSLPNACTRSSSKLKLSHRWQEPGISQERHYNIGNKNSKKALGAKGDSF